MMATHNRFRSLCFAVLSVAGLLSASGLSLTMHGSEVVRLAITQYGAQGGQTTRRWVDLMAQIRGLSEVEKLARINEFWNRSVRGEENIVWWKTADYWATPMETLGLAAGDCKAYVIGKFISLWELGIPMDKLRFVYARAQVESREVAHMVLAYYPSPQATPLVLDNLTDQILPSSDRTDLTPVLSFNAAGIYIKGERVAPVDRIGRWRDLLQRMQTEGITVRP
jgi:predicted transglutaminase-like cysteine proteinase